MQNPIIVTILLLLLLKTLNPHKLKILCLTQNQGGILKLQQKNQSLKEAFQSFIVNLQAKVESKQPDLIIIGLQEIIELKPKAILSAASGSFMDFAKISVGIESEAKIDTSLNNNELKILFKNNFGDYEVKFTSNISMSTFVLYKISEEYSVKVLKYLDYNENGVLVDSEFKNGFMGQKGGSISLVEFIFEGSHNLKVIHINSHLDSNESSKRFEQFGKLLEKVQEFLDGNSIKNYTLFFSGDMNSRLNDDEKSEIEEIFADDGLLNKAVIYKSILKTNEEFKKNLTQENVIPVEEADILFAPTYKLVLGQEDCTNEDNFENCYKTENDKQKFAYTDRILYFSSGDENHQKITNDIEYNVIDCKMFSDHFTVYGVFEIEFEHDEEEIEVQDFKGEDDELEEAEDEEDIETKIKELVISENAKTLEKLGKFLELTLDLNGLIDQYSGLESNDMRDALINVYESTYSTVNYGVSCQDIDEGDKKRRLYLVIKVIRKNIQDCIKTISEPSEDLII